MADDAVDDDANDADKDDADDDDDDDGAMTVWPGSSGDNGTAAAVLAAVTAELGATVDDATDAREFCDWCAVCAAPRDSFDAETRDRGGGDDLRGCAAAADEITAALRFGDAGGDNAENCTDGRDGDADTDADADVDTGADAESVGEDGDDDREEEVGGGGSGSDDDGDASDHDDGAGNVTAARRGSAHSRSDAQSSAERTAAGAVRMLLAASSDDASFAGDAGNGESDADNDDNDSEVDDDDNDSGDEAEDGIESPNNMRCASPFIRGASSSGCNASAA
jgi:hypothetical protein